jgi:hypothetical protein
MKKNLLLAITCIAFSTVSFGQIQIIGLGTGHVVNDSTVKCYGNTLNQMSKDFDVYNSGVVDLDSVYARRDSVKLPCRDTDNCFCWGGFCYSNSITISILTEKILKGDSSTGLNSLQCHYDPDGFVGSWSVKYTVYNHTNPKDSAWVIVKYIVSPAGVQDISGGTVSFSAYPNPATNSVNFNYNFSNGVQAANLKIFNLLGECVQTVPLNTSKSKTTLDVQSMPAGIYVCEMEADGCQPTYQKLIVSH